MKTLNYLIRSEPSKHIYTVQVLKELGVTLAAINFIFLNDSLTTVEFNSYKLGITKFSISEKKFHGNLWETENDAKAISNLNYHYTSIGLDSATNNDSDLRIYSLVLEIIDDPSLAKIIFKVITQGQSNETEIEDYFNEKCF
jgi:hypothetical protein